MDIRIFLSVNFVTNTEIYTIKIKICIRWQNREKLASHLMPIQTKLISNVAVLKGL